MKSYSRFPINSKLTIENSPQDRQEQFQTSSDTEWGQGEPSLTKEPILNKLIIEESDRSWLLLF